MVGLYAGFRAREELEPTMRDLELFAPDEVLPETMDFGDGPVQVTAGELRSMLESEVLTVYLTFGVLVVSFLACFSWSRKSPVPAIATGLGIYITVILLGAVADPATLVQGLVIKVIVILTLVNGLKSALQQRARAAV